MTYNLNFSEEKICWIGYKRWSLVMDEQERRCQTKGREGSQRRRVNWSGDRMKTVRRKRIKGKEQRETEKQLG